jgi:3-dehydroquinate dehydratase II
MIYHMTGRKESKMKKVAIINGPNLNLLGTREKSIYGEKSFETILADLKEYSNQNNIEIEYFQSNSEGDILDKLHSCAGNTDFIILNPGALTHYSYSIHDAILALKIPVIEVHISNIFAREQWRQKSVISPAAKAILSGLGIEVYKIALIYIAQYYGQ